ncbi:MAG: cell division protein FtsL [Cellvibrionaceae bacterium]
MNKQGVRKHFLSGRVLLLIATLWLLVIASALAVVYVTYDTRVKFNELETLRREQSQLQVVWGQYLLEESTWAAYGRIEKLAEDKLLMQVPKAEDIIMVMPKGRSDEG